MSIPQRERLTAEQLFLDTVEDLRRRSAIGAQRYDMIQSAGLVRRLLVDRRGLLDIVNREPALKITFLVGGTYVHVDSWPSGGVYGQGPWLDAVAARLDLRRRLMEIFTPDELNEVSGLSPSMKRHQFLAQKAFELVQFWKDRLPCWKQ